ncbi:hypothetical protein [Modicisalibacter sp. 'Wilcox']|uniref:hypothetical protein n=1 Tax=Modicisalibacter sp. 'Wilcox' TaxID=2679914 RepID=UPI0013D325E2|nr:hypothetical protein [Modicisalibacter sp. 'Wilcox']
MRERLNDQEARQLAEEAMRPADRVVDFEDYGNRLGIAVYNDEGERVALCRDLTRRSFQRRDTLIKYLQEAREIVREQGIWLDDWQPS